MTSTAANMSTWFKNIKEALHTVEQFFMDKKKGQFPASVTPILQFIKAVLNNNVAEQFIPLLKNILSDRTYLGLMRKGLILRVEGGKTQAGEFFRAPKVLCFDISVDKTIYSIDIKDILVQVAVHGRNIDNVKKSLEVNAYVTNMFAQAIYHFITTIGPTFMEKNDRDIICGMMAMEKQTPPYSNGEYISVFKELIVDIIDDEDIGGYVREKAGESNVRSAKNFVKKFDTEKFGDAKGCITATLATRRIGPIKDGIKNFMSTFAGDSVANDGIKSYDQF